MTSKPTAGASRVRFGSSSMHPVHVRWAPNLRRQLQNHAKTRDWATHDAKEVPAMRFSRDVVVARSVADVAAFVDQPSNLARWDRSVARVEPTSPGATAVGFTFDTIAPSGMRMSYRIAE